MKSQHHLAKGKNGRLSLPYSSTIGIMRRNAIYTGFIIVGTILFLCSCTKSPDAYAARTSKIGKTAVNGEAPQVKRVEADSSLPLEQRVNDLLSQTRIPLSSEYHLLQVINVNLDIDQIEEQIIIFKKKNDPSDRIKLMVVDFDNVRNTYIVTWQGETQGTNNRAFTVFLQDLIGDHVISILCYGRNNKGEQTLDVFRKTPSPNGLGLYYNSIVSIASNGSIEVEDRQRSEAYQLLQKNDESFAIIVYSRDPDSTNISDLIKTTHYWNPQENRYIPAKHDKIPGQIVAEKQIAELFNKESEEFEKFLSGPWFLTSSSDSTGKPRNTGEIIHFDPKLRKITFYKGEIQEVFNWSNSYRTIYRGLYINCTNEAISSITKQISISVSGTDSFDMQVRGGEGWDGQYKRLNKDLQYAYLSSRKAGVKLSTVQLAGLFKGENGTELYFSAPNFTLRESNKELSGGYAIYSFSGDILELKVIKENGLVDSSRTYRILLQEETKGKRTIRNLILQPALVNYKSVDVKSVGSLRFQQIVDSSSN